MTVKGMLSMRSDRVVLPYAKMASDHPRQCIFFGTINPGDTLKIRLPNQYVVRTGPTLSAQDTTESSVPLQIATQKGVDLNFTSSDLTLSLDDFSGRILEPAMAVLAAAIEADALSMRKDVYQQVNNAGSNELGNEAFFGSTRRQ